jgi:outer membrane protein OmpA-like peptidoglycan-associated protein
MRDSFSLLAVALLGGCAASHPAPTVSVVSAELGIFRAAELARVRCLLVAPFENASSAPLAAASATSSLLSGVSASGTRVFPVGELRALFRDTPVELPEGVPPGLAMELAQLVGADAAVYGTVEGKADGADPGLVVSVRLALSPSRELLYASTFAVKARPGETIETAVRRALADATHEMFLRLGGFRGGSCFDQKRLDSLRALAVADAAPRPHAAAGPAPTPAPVATQQPSASPAQSRPAAITPRQKEWALRLGLREQFLIDDVAFAGRTAQLLRDSGLADLAIAILSTPEIRVRVEGHVDATNDAAADARVSMDMARAAVGRLVELGVPAGRVLVSGRGAENPLLPNFTARGRTANRRVEAVGLK